MDLTDETKEVIREALQHRERNHAGFAESDRQAAIECLESEHPAIRDRATGLDLRSDQGWAKAETVRRALEEFDRECS